MTVCIAQTSGFVCLRRSECETMIFLYYNSLCSSFSQFSSNWWWNKTSSWTLVQCRLISGANALDQHWIAFDQTHCHKLGGGFPRNLLYSNFNIDLVIIYKWHGYQGKIDTRDAPTRSRADRLHVVWHKRNETNVITHTQFGKHHMGNTFFVPVPFLSLRELLSFFTLPLINCIQHLHAKSDLTRRLDKIEIMRRPVQGYPAHRRQTIIY